MSLTTALATYFIIWWVTLFAVLPWGIKSQEEAGEIEPGTMGGAPTKAMMGRKILATTLVASIIFLIFYLNVTMGWVTLDDIPFLPRFE